MSTLIRRNGPRVRPLLGVSTIKVVSIYLTIQVPTTLFILLIGMLKTRIQKGECWKSNVTRAYITTEALQ